VKSATHPFSNLDCWNNIKTGLPILEEEQSTLEKSLIVYMEIQL